MTEEFDRETFEKAQELLKEARETGDDSKLIRWMLGIDEKEYQESVARLIAMNERLRDDKEAI